MVWFYRLRAGLLFLWPFLASLAVMAVLVACGAVVLSALDRDQEQEALNRDLKALVERTNAAAEVNRRLIERGNPCVAGDNPESEACIAQRLTDSRLADALAAVQAQHDEQARQVADAVDRLVELQLRNHGSTTNAGSSPRPPARPAPRITASGPTSTTTPPAPPAPAEPAPTTTACDQRGKSGRCK